MDFYGLRFTERVCHTCGKHFECQPEYVYQRKNSEDNGKALWFCSWGCMRKYDKEKEKKAAKNERKRLNGQEVMELYREGFTVREISGMLRITEETIQDYLDSRKNIPRVRDREA